MNGWEPDAALVDVVEVGAAPDVGLGVVAGVVVGAVPGGVLCAVV
ncbi:MAG: hypothetical protein ACXWKQ_11080 [Reyranella sp.]